MSLVQHQHHADLAVALGVEPLGHALERRAVAQEDAQALLQLGGGLLQRLDRLDARAHLVALQLRRQEQQHRRARLQQVAVLRQPLGEQHRLVMAGRIGQPDDAHLAAGADAPLRARHHGRRQPAGAAARLHRAGEFRPGLHAHALERRRHSRRADGR